MRHGHDVIGRDAFVGAIDQDATPRAPQASASVLDERIPIEMWPRRVECALSRLGVYRWRDLAGLSPARILMQKALGRAGLNYIRRRMDAVGVRFDASLPRPPAGGRVTLTAACGVYFLRGQEFIKIGSAGNMRARAINLGISLPFDLEPIGSIYTVDRAAAFALEKQLHTRFDAVWHRGEWFQDCAAIRYFVAKHSGSTWAGDEVTA